MPRVLIVEDEKDVRDLLVMTAREHGFDVVEAPTGRRALEELCRACVSKVPFDVMLLDISMPDVNGWHVLGAVQANPLWRALPVVVVTGQARSPADITRMARHGAYYVDKGTDFLRYVGAMLDRIASPG